jgi:hypothetical protein
VPRKFTTDELIRIAHARFEPINRGEEPPKYEAIASMLNKAGMPKLNSVGVSVALKHAISRRLIKVSIAEGSSPAERDRSLEAELEQRFPHLRTALVADDDASSAPIHAEVNPTSGCIGALLGNYLSESRIVRPRMRIGIGSGTAVSHTCRQVEHRRRISEFGLTLYSLTGAFGHRSPDDQNTLMDSDDNAASFGRGVTRPCSFEKLGTLVILPTKTTDTPLSQTWMGRDKVEPPDVLLVGAGAFSRQWKFYEALGQPADRDVQKLMQELDSLVRKVRLNNDAEKPPFTPVGDIGCRLIRPPQGNARISTKDAQHLDHLVAEINRRLCTVKENWLFGPTGQIPLWLVAGSDGSNARKATVIYYAMRRCLVDTFVTDASTARAVLKLAANDVSQA